MRVLRHWAGTLLFLCAVPVAAQETAAREPATDEAFKTALAANLSSAGEKLVALAEATGAEAFSWRPSDEVRTVSEIYMHIVGANFHLPSGLGAAAPEGIEIPQTGPYALRLQQKRWEAEITDKAAVVDMLRRSFDYAVAAIPEITDLDAVVAPAGFRASKREYLFILLTHAHEHLGQSIAYARSLGIVPPWSRQVERATPDSDAVFENGAATGHVLSFDRFGNLVTSFVASDLKRLGLAVGDHLQLSSGTHTVEVFLGESVFDVRLGEWVAFVSLSGRLIVGQSYGRAITALESDVDERLTIRPATAH